MIQIIFSSDLQLVIHLLSKICILTFAGVMFSINDKALETTNAFQGNTEQM